MLTNANTFTFGNFYSNSYADSDCRNTYAHAYAFGYGNRNTGCDCRHSYAYPYAYSYGHGNINADSDTYTYRYRDCNTDSYYKAFSHAKIEAGTKASADRASAAIGHSLESEFKNDRKRLARAGRANIEGVNREET